LTEIFRRVEPGDLLELSSRRSSSTTGRFHLFGDPPYPPPGLRYQKLN
jgi:hypothetical protein